MGEKRREKVSRYDMITGEDTYASQTAQNPATSRRLQSLIPVDNGALYRELAEPLFASTTLPGEVRNLYEFDQNDSNGNVVRFWYAVAAVTPGASTYYLYQYQAGTPATWVRVTAVGTLQNVPVFVTINNLLHMIDGSKNWIFDGLNWNVEGFPIPYDLNPSVAIGAGPGFTATIGRYYWFTWADQTVNRVHESSTSFNPTAASAGGTLAAGPFTNKNVVVSMFPGTASVTSGATGITFSTAITNTSVLVGMVLYVNGVNVGTIASFTNSTTAVLAANAPSTQSGSFTIAPVRATHWHIYASEADGSQVGQFLAAIPIATASYSDTSPFAGATNTLFAGVFRPVRNDPAQPSSLQTVHKYRIFRRLDSFPAEFFFSANEEVIDNGNPSESFPGVDPNTQSDLINQQPYPDESNRIRGMISHADALYIFTERNGLPLWGESLDDFALSQVNAFNVGIAGKFAGHSTAHGLAFLSYDRKAFLYPTTVFPWAYVPKDLNVTDQLVEIGKPMRAKFEQIKYANLDQVFSFHYKFGRRDWWVLGWQDNANVYWTYVYDFTSKAWFQLQRGFTSLAVFEVQNGITILVGGGSDGNVYVIDDLTGTYTSASALPAALWRTALIDFGDPDAKHVPRYIEFELTNAAMAADIQLNYYLDPSDVDNPGTPRSVIFAPVRGSNLYRGFFRGGNLCQRLLLEFNIASSTNAGAIRGVKLTAEHASSLVM